MLKKLLKHDNLLVVLFIVCSSLLISNDYSRSKIYLGFIFATPLILWRLFNFANNWLRLTLVGLMSYLLIHGIYCAYSPWSAWIGLNPTSNDLRLAFLAGLSVLYIIGIISLLKILSKSLLDKMFYIFTMVNASYTIMQFSWFHDSFLSSGLINNRSMNACMLACSIPLLKNKWQWAWILISIACSNSNAGWACAGVTLGILLGGWRGILAMTTTAGIATLLLWHRAFSDSGRFIAWKSFITWWSNNANHWVGTGTGSFYLLGALLPPSKPGGYFTWMHNDWLQILFEQGLIGFGMIVPLYLWLIWKAKTDKANLAMLVSCGIWASFNYPLRLFPCALFLGYVVCNILVKEKTHGRQWISG